MGKFYFRRLMFMACLVLGLSSSVSAQLAWYSTTPGSDVSNLSSWWSNNNNTGTHPTSFATTNTTWIFQGNATSSAPLSFTGNVTISAGSIFTPLASSVTTVGGNWVNTDGTFNNNGGTVLFSGANGVATDTISGTYGGLTGTNRFNNITFTAPGVTYTFLANAADVAGNFVINSGSVTAPSSTLQIYGAYTNSGSFNNNSGTVAFAGSTAGTILSGNMTGTNKFNNLTFNGSGSWTFNGNNADVAGNLTIASGSTLTTGANTLNVVGNWTNNGSFNSAGGTVNFNGASGTYSITGLLTAANQFNNLGFTGTGANYSFGSSSADVAGNLNLSGSAGTVTAPSTTLQVAGNWNHSGNITFNNNSGTVNMNGSGTLSGNLSGANKFNNLTFNNAGGTWTISSPLDAGGNFTITNATSVNASGATTINVFGSFANNASGATFTAPATLNDGGNWTNLGTFANNSGLVNMNGAGSFTISGNMTGASKFNNLTFNNAGGNWSFGGSSVDVGGNFTITAGSVTAPTGNINVAGNWNNNGGSFNNNGGTVTMNGAGASSFNVTSPGTLTGSNKFYNLTFNGGGAYTFNANADVANNWTITSGQVVAPSILNIGGNWTNNSAAATSFNSNSGTVNMNGSSGALTIGGAAAMTGNNAFYNLNFDGGASWSFTAANATVNNNFNIMSGTVTAPSGTLQIGNTSAGNYTNSGNFVNNNGTVLMYSSASGINSGTLNGSMLTTNKFYNLTFNGNSTNTTYSFTATNADVANNFTQSAVTVTAPSNNLNVAGNFIQNSGVFNPNSGTVSMIGTGATNYNVTTNNMNSLGTSDFYNLVFNGTPGSTTFTFNPLSVTVNNNFTITNGIVVAPTSSATLTVGGSWSNNGTFTAGATGTVAMVGNTAGLTLSGNMTGANKFNNLTFNGGSSAVFTFASAADVGGNLNKIGSGTLYAPASNLNVAGSFNMSAGNFNPNGGTLTMNGGGSPTFTFAGTEAIGTNWLNNLTFNGGGNYAINNNLLLAGNFTNTSGTVNTTLAGFPLTLTVYGNWTNSGTFSAGATTANGSTVNMVGTTGGLQLNGTLNFYNLTFNGIGGSWNMNSATATVANNFTITNGNVTAPVTTLNIAGNYSNAGTFIAPSGSTVNFNGSNASETLTGTMTGSSAFYNLTFSGTGTNNATLNNKVAATNNFTVANTGTSNTFSENGFTVIVGNNFNIAGANAAFTNSNAVDTIYVGGNYNNSGSFFSGTANVVNMTGSVGSYTLTGNMTGANAFNSLYFTGGAGWTFGSTAAQTNSNFYIASGTVTAPSSTLTIGNGLNTLAASYTNFGTFNNNSGTVVMQGSSGNMVGNMTGSNRFNNLTFAAPAGTYTFSTNPAEVYGNFNIIGAANNVTAPSTTLTIWGAFNKSAIVNAATTPVTNISTGTFNPNGGTVVMQGGTTTTTQAMATNNMNSGTSSSSGSSFNNLTFNGVTGSSAWTWNTYPSSFSVYGNFAINGGTVIGPGATYTVTVGGSPTTATSTLGGNWTNNGVFNYNSSTSGGTSVTMTGSNTAATLNGNMTKTTSSPFYNLGFVGTGTWQFTNPADVGSTFAQVTGASTVIAPSVLQIGANFIHTVGAFNPNAALNGTVVMNAAAAGTSGSATPAGVYSVTATSMTTLPTASAPNCFNNLTFNGGTGINWNLTQSCYLAGNMAIYTGTVTPTASITTTVYGNWTNNAVFNAANGTTASSTVTMAGTTAGLYLSGNMTAATNSRFYTLTFNGVGGQWTFNNPADVLGIFTLTNGTVNAPVGNLQLLNNVTLSTPGVFNNNGGTVSLVGVASQVLGGSLAGVFNNLVINNSTGVQIGSSANLNVPETVNGTLTLQSGIVTLGYSTTVATNNNLILGPTATAISPGTAGSFSNANMIVERNTNLNTGNVQKLFTGIGSYLFPLGDTITNNYSPITVNVTGGTFGAGAYVAVSDYAKKDPNNANLYNYLARYWNVTLDSITSPAYSVSAMYGASDVVGMESNLISADFTGSLPFLTFGPVNTATHTLTSGTVNSYASQFTAISGIRPTVVATNPNYTICQGQSVQLTYMLAAGDSTGPYTYSWSPGGSLSATMGSVVTATPSSTTIYSITVTDANGFSSVGTTTVTVNPLPAPITGGPSICAGFTLPLSVTSAGGTYTSGNVFQATVNPASGVVSALAAGHPIIYYTLPTGCYDSTILTVNATPAPVSGATNACIGATSTLGDATAGGTWSTSAPSVATVASGTVTGVSAGTVTISYTLTSDNCPALASFTVNALPAAYTVTGGGAYCAGGAGVNVSLSSSAAGFNYQLFDGGTPVGTQPGVTSFFTTPLSFGLQTAAGTYTIVSTNATTGCMAAMTGSVTVTVNPVPRIDTLGGGGSYCAGGAGVAVTLNNSVPGTAYLLYNDGASAHDTVYGSGSATSFGNQAAPGSYTAVAENFTTGCTSNIYGASVVNVNPLPEVDTLTGGGSYCYGGTGVHLGLNFASTGINYELDLAGSGYVYESITGGANSALDFGAQTAGGVYTAIATNTVTGCTSNMAGSETVTVDPLPVAAGHIVSGSGSYCAGGTGVSLMLSPSDAGISYQLVYGGSPVGPSVAGTGSSISFAPQTAAGAYTVMGTNTTTGCTNMMTGSATITINPLPVAENVTGTSSYCAGGTGVNIGLANSQNGVTYYLYNNNVLLPGSTTTSVGGPLSFGLQTLAGGYTVTGTNLVTGCSNNMTDTAVVTIDPLPTVYALTGGGSYCSGGAGHHIGITYSDIGVSYQLQLAGVNVGMSQAGANSSLDFGAQTTGGAYTILATNSVTGCTKVMGGVTITVDSLPVVYIVGASASSYCFGGAGISISLSGSNTGITYQLWNGTTEETTMAGTGSSIHFGLQTLPGTYTVIAKNNTTSCADLMTGSAPIVINSLPTAYTVTGGGSYCSGSAGDTVGLSNSDTGVNYQLYVAGGASGAPVTGTGMALSFGPQAAGGAYTVVATNNSTTCTSNMSGSVNVAINPLPSVDTVTGGGGYCVGGTGAVISLNTSDLGVNYQVYSGGLPVGSLVSGTGSMISLGAETIVGDYTVVGTDAGSACTSNMYGSVSVTINPLPTAYTVLGGGGYCAGGAGVIDSLSGSDLGINYILYNGATLVDSMSGTGGVINYGYQTTPGIYSVLARNATTGCTSHMIYNDTVSINPLPTAYTVTGGGNYCSGGMGVHIGLSAGVIGINYQLYNDTTHVGAPVAGDGLALDFGLETMVGAYSVVGTNGSTGCTSNMSGTVSIDTMSNVTPSVTISVPGGDTVCAGSVVNFTPVPVNGGTAPTYQWSVNGAYASAGSTYSYVPADMDIVSVTLTSSAACTSFPTATNSISLTVHTHEMPTASITANPGTSVCPGTPVTFTGTTTFAGPAPEYFWVVNSVMNSTPTPSYTYTPDNHDYVVLMLVSNYPCATMDTVFSNNFVLYVDTMSPSVSIVAHPGQNITKGQSDTLTAVTVNAGTTPGYKWYVNSTLLTGDTSATIVSNQFGNNDSVTCVVTTGGGACSGVTVFNSLKIAVAGNVGVGQVSTTGGELRVSPNPNKGAFSIIGTLGTNTDEDVAVEMSDVVGQTVYTGIIQSKKGNVNAKVTVENTLASGMYLLTLRSASGITILHVVIEQ